MASPPFLRLPFELRVRILEFVAAHINLSITQSGISFDDESVLGISRQITKEALPVLFEWSTVAFASDDIYLLLAKCNSEIIYLLRRNRSIRLKKDESFVEASFLVNEQPMGHLLHLQNGPTTLAWMFWSACETGKSKLAEQILAKIDRLGHYQKDSDQLRHRKEPDLITAMLEMAANDDAEKSSDIAEGAGDVAHIVPGIDQQKLLEGLLDHHDTAKFICRNGRVKVLKLITDVEATMHASQRMVSDWIQHHGYDAITHAVRGGHHCAVKLLLEKGAATQQNDRYSPLDAALTLPKTSPKKIEIILSLVCAGVTVRDFHRTFVILVDNITQWKALREHGLQSKANSWWLWIYELVVSNLPRAQSFYFPPGHEFNHVTDQAHRPYSIALRQRQEETIRKRSSDFIVRVEFFQNLYSNMS